MDFNLCIYYFYILENVKTVDSIKSLSIVELLHAVGISACNSNYGNALKLYSHNYEEKIVKHFEENFVNIFKKNVLQHCN